MFIGSAAEYRAITHCVQKLQKGNVNLYNLRAQILQFGDSLIEHLLHAIICFLKKKVSGNTM